MNDRTLGPPTSPGWYWCKDAGVVADADPWWLTNWDGKTLRIFTPDTATREWPFEWDGEDWICVSDDGYSELDPVEWIPIARPTNG